eukprot:evm.model.scf_4203.1 EVM.evm.TU.scf_4203.1   scf_4203:7224-7660(-)
MAGCSSCVRLQIFVFESDVDDCGLELHDCRGHTHAVIRRRRRFSSRGVSRTSSLCSPWEDCVVVDFSISTAAFLGDFVLAFATQKQKEGYTCSDVSSR